MAQEVADEKAQGVDLAKKLRLSDIAVSGNGYKVSSDQNNARTTKGQRIFLRADFNVPLDKQSGEITDDNRIRATIPTFKAIVALGFSRLVVTSHLGRPAGNVNEKLSLAPVAKRLQELLAAENLAYDVELVQDWYKNDLEDHLNGLQSDASKTIYLLENARFYIEEEGKGTKNGEKVKADKNKMKEFQAILTSITDLYINDAFGTCHRAHSSMVFPAPIRVAGLLVSKELEYFSKVTSNPQRPYLAILGGAKVSDKIKVIQNLLEKVDKLIIVGGMAYTFLKIRDNVKIGKSLYDENASQEIVPKILDTIKNKGNKFEFLLPSDSRVGDNFDASANATECKHNEGIPDNSMGLDIGPNSEELFSAAITSSKTIVWNGPAGVFEFPNFKSGTISILKAITEATKNGAVSIIGGGDSAAAFGQFQNEYSLQASHISTGGGASLELLEGKDLPGVVALTDRQ